MVEFAVTTKKATFHGGCGSGQPLLLNRTQIGETGRRTLYMASLGIILPDFFGRFNTYLLIRDIRLLASIYSMPGAFFYCMCPTSNRKPSRAAQRAKRTLYERFPGQSYQPVPNLAFGTLPPGEEWDSKGRAL